MPYSQMAAMGQPGYNDYFRDMVLAAQEANRRAEWVGDHVIPNAQGTATVVPAVPEAGLQEPMFTPGDVAGLAGAPARVAAGALADVARAAAIRSEVAKRLNDTLLFSKLRTPDSDTNLWKILRSADNPPKDTVRRGAAQTSTAPAKQAAPANVDHVTGSEPQFRERTIAELFAHTDPAMEFLRRAYDIPEWTPDIYRSIRDMMPYQYLWDGTRSSAIQSPARGIDMESWADKYISGIWDKIHSGAIDPYASEFQLLQDLATTGIPAWRWNK